MRTTKEALSTRVVVRRMWTGAKPFGWEIRGAEMAKPLCVSNDAFDSLASAYQAGQARLEEFVQIRRTPSPSVAGEREPGIRRHSVNGVESVIFAAAFD